MKLNSNSRIVTICDNKPEMFDRKINNIISRSKDVEIVFNTTRPLLVHIVYTENTEKEGRKHGTMESIL